MTPIEPKPIGTIPEALEGEVEKVLNELIVRAFSNDPQYRFAELEASTGFKEGETVYSAVFETEGGRDYVHPVLVKKDIPEHPEPNKTTYRVLNSEELDSAVVVVEYHQHGKDRIPYVSQAVELYGPFDKTKPEKPSKEDQRTRSRQMRAARTAKTEHGVGPSIPADGTLSFEMAPERTERMREFGAPTEDKPHLSQRLERTQHYDMDGQAITSSQHRSLRSSGVIGR